MPRVNVPQARPLSTPSGGGEVTLPKPQEVPAATRAEVAKASADKMVAIVERHKDVTGNGMEWTGAGDPRINERRGVLSVMVAARDKNFFDLAKLEASTPGIKEDIKWIRDAERTEASLGDRNQFAWSKNDSSTSSVIFQEFDRRVTAGKQDAAAFVAGTGKFVDGSQGTVIAASFIDDREKKAAALADLLMQFAGPGDKSKQARIATVGPAAVAEQRILLAGANLAGDDLTTRREYALLSLVVAQHPMSSVNAVFEARNSVAKLEKNGVAWVKKNTAPGSTHSAYETIHHNFSSATPANIDAFVSEFVFAAGPKEQRPGLFLELTNLLVMAREKDARMAKELIASLAADHAPTLDPLATKLSTADDGEVADHIVSFLKDSLGPTIKTGYAAAPLGSDPEANLILCGRLLQAVSADRPTLRTLEASLFKSGEAWPEVADVIACLRDENERGLMKELGEARASIRNAVVNSKFGYERHELFKFDAQLHRMSLESLGACVERVGDCTQPEQMADAMLGVQAALRTISATGLDALQATDDPAAKKGRPIEALLADVNGKLAAGKCTADEYRALMGEVYVSMARIVQNMRSFFDQRIPALAASRPLDPEFLDQLVKQSPMHYATALAQKGMRAGLTEVITDREVKNVTGARVLNSVGPVVFSNVVFAEGTADLLKLGPKKDDLAVLYSLSEKKMVAVGGLIADVKNAPGGNSHLNMYAMNNGITVLALPELRTKYATFFQTAAREGGIYCDDKNGEFSMMTVAMAQERGLIAGQANPAAPSVEELKPGTNKIIKYLRPDGDAFQVFARHEAMISPSRPVREIELYVPVDEVKGMGKVAHSFLELSRLGTQARHLAGEKGTVLALLKAHPKLGKYVPDGSQLSPSRCVMLLKEAGINDEWEKPWRSDPKVGIVDDNNFMQSAFYTDARYRRGVRESLQHVTKEKLEASLISADGTSLTPAGQKLYDELVANPALAASDNWIARSSFTGEDRPNKSGAGQYESFPNLKDPVARIKGVIGVIESAWMAEPVENNVADQINLRHIMPSVTVMHCLKPTESGVMISRDTENGARGVVSYQLVKGFGGGVEGGKTEEGSISLGGAQRKIDHPDVDYRGTEGLVPRAALAELRDIVLEVEKFFNDVVEPGTGAAVDMEVARVDGQWQIVQARVIGLGK